MVDSLGIVGNIKTIEDYGNARQAMQNNLQAQQLDALNKQNVYATQVISGATATGDQGAYNNALQHLQNNGIDVSSWAPDVRTAAVQAQAARQSQYSQNPLAPLLNAATKMDANNVAASSANGTPAVPNAISGKILNGGSLVGALGGQSPQAPQPSLAGNSITPALGGGQWVNPDTQQPNAANLPQSLPETTPPQQAQPVPPTAIGMPQNNYTASDGSFLPPQNDPTKNFAANKAAFEQAFQAHKESPLAVRANAASSEQGKTDVVAQQASDKANELTDRLTQNLKAMLKLNDSVPSQGVLPASTGAYASRAMQNNPILNKLGIIGADTSGREATAFDQWNQINNQQVLSEIQQFIASGGANTRINQTLEKIAKAASSIDPNASPESRKAQINNALAELENKNISGKNLVSDNKGQPTQPYTAIPVTLPNENIPTGGTLSGADKAVQESGMNMTPPKKGEVRSGYLFLGGNPNDKNSYRKVQ